MTVISVINYKGGVGKTTLTANLGAELAARGQKVLLIDFDPQTSLTLSFYKPVEWATDLRERLTLKNWFDALDGNDGSELAHLIVTPPRANESITHGGRLDLIASHFELIQTDMQLAGMLLRAEGVRQLQRRDVEVHTALAKALRDPRFADYDLILIDCPPNFNIATRIAMVASDYAIIPARADYLSTIGIDYLIGSYRRLIQNYNETVQLLDGDERAATIDPKLLGVVFTMVQFSGTRPFRAQENNMVMVRQAHPVFTSMMRYNNSLYGDAGEGGIPVALMQSLHPDVATDLDQLATEFIKRLSNDEGVEMSNPPNLAHDVADILTVMVAQIRTLSENETRALLAGEAEFKVVARKRAAAATRPAKAATPSSMDADPDQVRRALDACDSEAAATTYLQGLKLSASAAKALAIGLGLRLPARPTGPAINAEIVRVFVSGRLNAATVQGL